MPLKLNVGVNKKIADGNYGSRGAGVNLEVELDSGLVQEPERLQDRIRQLFRLAQQSVDEELNQTQGQPASTENGRAAPAASPPASATPPANGNGAEGGNGRAAHMASEKQLVYARQLAGQVKGLGIRGLETLAQKMFGKPLAALSSFDASGLIDTLKSIKAGQIDLQAVLNGGAP